MFGKFIYQLGCKLLSQVLEPSLVAENGHAVNSDDAVAGAQIPPEEEVAASSAAPVEIDASTEDVEVSVASYGRLGLC